MDNETIKSRLLEIENTDIDFTVTLTGKESKKVNGLYKPDTHEILLHNKNFKTDNQLMYTAIHEYTHHLITEEEIAEGKTLSKNSKVHTNAFWARFHELLEVAEEKGYYDIDLAEYPELDSLTKEIRSNYLEANGKLMVEFGKKLAKAHELCEASNIRYEDYLDRVLKLPRQAAKNITKVASVQINPSIGFENMKMVSSIKKPEERAEAEKELMSGKSPETVKELMKRKAQKDVDPKEKLEKEKNRLTKTINELEKRLEIVEESLANM